MYLLDKPWFAESAESLDRCEKSPVNPLSSVPKMSDRVETELQEQIAKLREATGYQSTTETKNEDEAESAPVEMQHVLRMPTEALVWMQQCELNNQKFRSELERRIRPDQQVTYVPSRQTTACRERELEIPRERESSIPREIPRELITMLCEGKVVFTAERVLLGLHSQRTVTHADPECQTGGIAPGTYHSWMWPWTVYDDDPRAQEIKPQVDAMTELDHHRKDFTMFQDIVTLRYILAVLTRNMKLEHVLPISPEGGGVADHIFGLRNIQYGPVAESSKSAEKAD